MVERNSHPRNTYVRGGDNYSRAPLVGDNAQEKHAVLAQWQSSGFVNSAESFGTQTREHSQSAGGRQAPEPKRTARTVRPWWRNDVGWVYFLENSDGFVKIGWALNPQARVADLQIGSAQPLKLLGVVAGDRRLEAEFHRTSKAARFRGEWFDPRGCPLLAGFVERMRRDGAERERRATGGLMWRLFE